MAKVCGEGVFTPKEGRTIEDVIGEYYLRRLWVSGVWGFVVCVLFGLLPFFTATFHVSSRCSSLCLSR